jgi:aldehyde dehydrogenase (NAD+)
MVITTMTKATTYHNFIDGRWVPSVSEDVFENRNPAQNDDLIGLFRQSTRKDVHDAVDAARCAYESWRLVPAPRRAALLFRAAQLIAERKEALARDMTREMGKILD